MIENKKENLIFDCINYFGMSSEFAENYVESFPEEAKYRIEKMKQRSAVIKNDDGK